MNFPESVKYLMSLGNEVSTMKLGLENIRSLLRLLGDPQRAYVGVQIAGTNGKGSVCAFVGSIIKESKLKVGVMTSPHLIDIRERIVIDGHPITEELFAEIATTVRQAAEQLAEGEGGRVPTFFEQITAIGAIAFKEHSVDIAVLETGLGGRLDAVTAFDAGFVGISRIALDHQEYLGSTLFEIAGEKAAVIRRGSRAVIGLQCEEAMSVILERCSHEAVLPVRVDLIDISVTEEGPDGSLIRIKTARDAYRFRVALAGRHQVENAAIAVLIAELLSQDGFPTIGKIEIERGIERAAHPGRMETVNGVILDGAHNASGAEALANHLRSAYDCKPIIIFGAMRDKDVRSMAESLFPLAHKVILTAPSNSRAMNTDELAKIARDLTEETAIEITVDIKSALTLARRIVIGEGPICVTGSLYLVGEARAALLAD